MADMRFLLGHFFRRLPREGIKSLSVPLIAFVLVVLINLLGGVKAWLESEYEDTLDNYPIVVELSDLTGERTDGLHIEERYISLFTDPNAPLSLYNHTRDIILKRGLEINIPGHTAILTGITSIAADDALDDALGAAVTFYGGYDESVFNTKDTVCLISENLLPLVKNGVFGFTVTTKMPDETFWEKCPVYLADLLENPDILEVNGRYYLQVDYGLQTHHLIEVFPVWNEIVVEGESIITAVELTVAGTVSGVGDRMVYAPFWTASRIDELPTYSERLSIILADNRALSGFKQEATLNFPRVRPIFDSRPFAMTVYDSLFYETLEPLRQNIILIDVATPFIYVLSVCVGFIASILLTRRRRPEFAVMRSVGVHKRDIFLGILTEQILLSAAGAALGCALIAAAWGYISFTRPAVFLGCYILGAVFSAIKSAGTNVLKILQEREQ
jgi:hypothetical protein